MAIIMGTSYEHVCTFMIMYH